MPAAFGTATFCEALRAALHGAHGVAIVNMWGDRGSPLRASCAPLYPQRYVFDAAMPSGPTRRTAPASLPNTGATAKASEASCPSQAGQTAEAFSASPRRVSVSEMLGAAGSWPPHLFGGAEGSFDLARQVRTRVIPGPFADRSP